MADGLPALGVPVSDALEAIYARIPTIDCKRLCGMYCGPIDMSGAERRRLAERGVHIPPLTAKSLHAKVTAGHLDCPALTALGQCSVYDARPLICRLWGVTEGLPCPWGCVPERVLSDQEARGLIAETRRVGR